MPLALGWHLCSAAMFTFGVILIFLYTRFLRDRATPLWIAQLIALFYIGYGIWAQLESHNAFFAVMFTLPGLLLLFAASGGVPKAS